MAENLRLEFDGNTTYDSTTTNLLPGTTITPSATQARNGTPTTAEYDVWKVSSYDSPTEAETNRWLSRGSHNSNGTAMRESDIVGGDITGENQYIGTFYNWYTATAGTGTYNIGLWVFTSADICPANWQLPRQRSPWYDLIGVTYELIAKSGPQGDDTTAMTKIHGIPFSYPFTGLISRGNGRAGWQGEGTFVWSGKSNGSVNSANGLVLHGPQNNIYTPGNEHKTNGNSIRCVTK